MVLAVSAWLWWLRVRQMIVKIQVPQCSLLSVMSNFFVLEKDSLTVSFGGAYKASVVAHLAKPRCFFICQHLLF